MAKSRRAVNWKQRAKLERDGPDFLRELGSVIQRYSKAGHVLALWRSPAAKEPYVVQHWRLKRKRGDLKLAWRLSAVWAYPELILAATKYAGCEEELRTGKPRVLVHG